MRVGKSFDPKVQATPGLEGVEDDLVAEVVLGWPEGRVSSPVDRECRLPDVQGVEDEVRAAEVIRRANNLGGGPAVLVHDLCGVVDVLDGVLGLGFFKDGRGGDALCLSELGHGVGFDGLIVGCGARHDDVRSDAGFVLTNALEDPLALLR